MQLFCAAVGNRVSEISSLLKDHPEIDVNWTDSTRWTALHFACRKGHVEIVKLLLAHPKIDVNLRSSNGDTPLSFGCWSGRVSVVRLLLEDPRVDITLENENGYTPLWWASCKERHEVIEWLIASGRDLGDLNKKRNWRGKDSTALEIARNFESTGVVSLLERFMANPAQTRHELRVKLGVLDELGPEVFALTIFLCDDLLQLKPASHPTAAAGTLRFFVIACKLPMELQMILCHRAVGSMRQNILRQDSEAAFKSLARILFASSSQQ